MNMLFNKLTKILRKQVGINSAVVPFSLGRIYQCVYRNWHHDPKPLILIIGSDAFYTVAINIHYLFAGQQGELTRYILLMRQSQVVLTGLAMYKVLKYRYPAIPKRAFRKYYTGMLTGKVVSEGISTAVEMNVYQFLADPYVKTLNKTIRPNWLGQQREPQMGQKVLQNVRSQVIQTSYNKQDISKPFANRQQRNIVQYRPDVNPNDSSANQDPNNPTAGV